jgi:carbonic anhydrase
VTDTPLPFADLQAANQAYVDSFGLDGLHAVAAKGLAIVTCMDSRIEPLGLFGLAPGDAKILRNAGGRVTDDVLRTLVLAVYLLGVTRVVVMPHTRCRMAQSSEDEIHELIAEQHGVDTSSLSFQVIEDPLQVLRNDVAAVRSHSMLPPDLQVAGAIYDVDTGAVTFIND